MSKVRELLELAYKLAIPDDPLANIELHKFFKGIAWLVPKGSNIDKKILSSYVKENFGGVILTKVEKIQALPSIEVTILPLYKVNTLVFNSGEWDILTPQGTGKNTGKIRHPKIYDLYSVWFERKE